MRQLETAELEESREEYINSGYSPEELEIIITGRRISYELEALMEAYSKVIHCDECEHKAQSAMCARCSKMKTLVELYETSMTLHSLL